MNLSPEAQRRRSKPKTHTTMLNQAITAACAQPDRQRQIPMQMDRLSVLTECTGDLLDRLEERLCPITVPQPPTPVKDPANMPISQELSAPQAEFVARMNDRIDRANARIESLLRRIEM